MKNLTLKTFMVNTARGIQSDPKTFDVIFNALTNNDKKSSFYLERTNKYNYDSNIGQLDAVAIWIFTEGEEMAKNLFVKISSKPYSEIFVISYKEIRLSPKDHFLKFDYQHDRMDRVGSSEIAQNFVREVANAFLEEKYAPRMHGRAWSNFIEPYEYYKSLKVDLLRRNFFTIYTKDSLPKGINDIQIENGKAYVVKDKRDSEYTFKTNAEVSKNINISLINSSNEVINNHIETIKVPIENVELEAKIDERIKYLKRMGQSLEMYGTDTKEAPILEDSTLKSLTDHRKSRTFIGVNSTKDTEAKLPIEISKKTFANLIKEIDELIVFSPIESKVIDRYEKNINRIIKESDYDFESNSNLINNKFIRESVKSDFITHEKDLSLSIKNLNSNINNLFKKAKFIINDKDVNLSELEIKATSEIDSLQLIISEKFENISKLNSLNSRLKSSKENQDKLEKEIEKKGKEINNLNIEKNVKIDEFKRSTKFEQNVSQYNVLNEKLENLDKNDKKFGKLKKEVFSLKSEIEKHLNLQKEIEEVSSKINDLENKLETLYKKLLDAKTEVVSQIAEIETFEIIVNNSKAESEIAEKDIIQIEKTWKEDSIRIESIAKTEIENLINDYEEVFDIYRESFSKFNSIKIFEEWIEFKFMYFTKENPNAKGDRFLYLADKQSITLLNTIYTTIRSIQRNGMNKELIKMIADQQHPISDHKIIPKPTNSKFLTEGGKLNNEQVEAFNLAVDMNNKLSIIQGPPGTGKTEVITRIAKHFRDKKQKVILASQSNEAIRNVIEKLLNDKTGPIFSRWAVKKPKFEYSFDEISKTLYNKTFKNFLEKVKSNDWEGTETSSITALIKTSVNELSRLETSEKDESYLKNYNIQDNTYLMGATTTTSATAYDKDKEFTEAADVLIIDEVSKSYLVEVLRYAVFVKKVILVGDYKQLPPLFDLNKDDFKESEIYSEEDFDDVQDKINKGIFADVTKRADKVGLNTQLVTNYRSIEEILNSYKIFYKPDPKSEIKSKELVPFRTNDDHLESTMAKYNFPTSGNFFIKGIPRYFVDIEGTSLDSGNEKSYSNLEEREYIKSILEDLLKLYKTPTNKSLGIIFMYAKQLIKFKNENRSLINKLDEIFLDGFRINTVDGFQGSESDIIIVSTTVTTQLTRMNRGTFLSNYRRINVALSRAKDVLIILGSSDYLQNLEMHRDGQEKKNYMDDVIKQIKNSDRSKFYQGEAW